MPACSCLLGPGCDCRYYEWLKKGKERLPHFTRHADGRMMLLAGLWDSVVLEGGMSVSCHCSVLNVGQAPRTGCGRSRS